MALRAVRFPPPAGESAEERLERESAERVAASLRAERDELLEYIHAQASSALLADIGPGRPTTVRGWFDLFSRRQSALGALVGGWQLTEAELSRGALDDSYVLYTAWFDRERMLWRDLRHCLRLASARVSVLSDKVRP